MSARFWAKVNVQPTGCWLWTGAQVKGYGRLRFGGRVQPAHRVAYEMTKTGGAGRASSSLPAPPPDPTHRERGPEMSREVRRVPRDYQHPREINRYRDRIEYIPLSPGEDFADAMADFRANPDAWDGRAPRLAEYMPDFTGRDGLWYCMYETTSEGTPISPVLPTPEALARWLTDTGATTFAVFTATYDQWLHLCRGGYATSLVYTPEDGLRSGVETLADEAVSGDR